MNLKTLLLVLFSLLFCVQASLYGDTYFITQEQLNNLTKQINNLQNNNASMMNLLKNQKLELENQKIELEKQTNEFQKLENSYSEKFLIMDQQLQNSQKLLNLSKNRESIYKYSIGIAFGLGLILGFVIAK